MPHVDEGQLHALLDGAFDDREARALHAHLETCAQCAARLEEERALRDRSTVILAAAQPARLATPPFDEVLHKARQRPARHTFWPGPGRLAWAATIVVALGVGWLSNSLMRLERAAPLFGVEESAAPQPAPANAPAAPPVANEPAAAPPKDASAGQRSAQSQLESRRADRNVALDSALSKTRALANDEAKKEKPAEMRQEQVVVTGIAAAARPDSLQRIVDTRGQAGAGRGAPPQAAPSQAQAAQQLVRDAVQSPAAQTTVRWENVTAEQAQARSGRKVLLVPELEVLNISIAAVGNTHQIRTVQRLPGGEILDLLQQTTLEGVAVGQVRRLEAERSRENRNEAQINEGTLLLRRDGVMLTGRAPLTQDSLRALLMRAR